MSEFWKNKIRTYAHMFDLDKDGCISEKEFTDMARNFADAYKADSEKTENLVIIFTNVFRKFMKASDVENEPSLTVAKFIESIKQQLYDPDLMIALNHLIRGLFGLMDVNQDGYLEPQEHSDWFKNCGVPEGRFDTKMAFEALDANGDGKISIDEFVAAFFDFFFSEDESSPNRFYFGPLVDETQYP